MTLSWQRYFEVILVVFVVVDTAESCYKDDHCKSHQVCCGKRCRSWPKCFLNSDKECYYDTHCIKGEVCVSNACKPRELPSSSCKTDKDCDNGNISSSHDRKMSHVKCCQGKCLDMKNCSLLLKINSMLTTPTLTTRAISGPCLGTFCTSGLECIDGKCTDKKLIDPVTDTEELDNTSLAYEKGILSAAFLIGAIFLPILCYCCLKKTQYAKKHCMSQEQDSASNGSCSHQVGNLSTVSPLNNHHLFSNNVNDDNRQFSQYSASRILFPGLYRTEGSHAVEHRNGEHREDCNSICTRPPSYRSVCFDQELPPSYDEAMNCHCQNSPENIPGATGRTQINI